MPDAVTTDLLALSVQDDVNDLGMFTLTLHNLHMNGEDVTWSDDTRWFAEGNEVAIQLGYVDALNTVMVGEITGLEPEFKADEPHTLIVRGHDRRHRLVRGHKTRSFVQIKDSDIARQVAGDAGLRAEVVDTQVTLDYVLQHNQTDLAFLQERAQRIGYEVVVEDKTLFFRPHQHSDAEVLTLRFRDDIIEFMPRLSTLTQVEAIEIRSWDPLQKEIIVGQAGFSEVDSTMGGTISGPQAIGNAFGQSRHIEVMRPLFGQDETAQIARGHLNIMALSYIQGEGTCYGNTALRAGVVIRIEGAGTRFSGQYYVVSTTHTVDAGQGYITEFSVRRTAS